MRSAPDLRPWELLVRFHRRAVAACDAGLVDAFGRGLDDYDVLHQLAVAGEPVPMTDLAEALLVANSSCHRVVSRLVADGLVVRASDRDDGRRVLVGLSEAGRDLHRRMARHHGRDIRRLFTDRLSDADAIALTRAFEEALDALDELR
jgi:DNA-binding MarR family transcriptional regulator